ncbi:transcription initiation factor TFIID subunit 4 isoform X2 [Cimex lectularius]|uniref:TAFH domain-containing protein n=1 Tax=Cimex lectularius TaxID=79782 RepID=A0A8I6R9X6_CIMLE|nr:transcription initiation factor TFIID subunit 4 isoform X2 [Cimex lectularius]
MASATKFLEEALSTDVDESAVNAIVGSLETQLVTSSPAPVNSQGQPISVQHNHVTSSISLGARSAPLKHGVSNGGADSMNILLNQDNGKGGGGQDHHNAVNTVVVGASAGQFINQLANNLGLVQGTVNKPEDGIKIIYPSNNQSVSVNNRVCYVNQSLTLPNGSIALTSNSDSLKSVQTFTQAGANVNKNAQTVADQSKPTGTAVVIKSALSSSQSSPITTMTNANSLGGTSTTGVVTLAKPINQTVGGQQTIVGGTPQIMPANVQIVNVNTLRANTPSSAGGAKGAVPSRVMIGTPQMVGGRAVQPGQITLQALQGSSGHILLKTDNLQFQLIRVAATTAQAAGQQTPVSTISTNNTYRVQTLSNASTSSAGVQTQVPPALNTTQGAVAVVPNSILTQRTSFEQTKEKCRKFLANLLELSSREPKTVERNVRNLIQELVDTKVEPEQFCDRLEKLLNASPQPCLIGFLKKSLPLLRQAMVNNEMVIEGIRAPPAAVIFSTANVSTTSSTPIRGQVQVAAAPQMRVITQHTTLRPGQPIQHRIITPMRMATTAQVANVNKGTLTTIRTPQIVRPTAQIVRTAAGPTLTLRPGQTLTKTQFTTRPVLATTQFTNVAISKPSLLKTPLAKEKEKKNFSSSGYMGDDDINDVAAMGGVNLAEESQRILGSTEFVGTQIRSCKDDIYLHSGPLMRKIAQIARKHGLEEPSGDVAALISHATQERLKNLVEKLAVIAEHRVDLNKVDPRYEVTQDVRAQLKCLEEIDRAERKRHEEQERELLLRAAKSKSKPEDPEQAKLKAKAKEMQRAEMEELRQREANLTALLAIGPRKKPKLDESSGTSLTLGSSSSSSSNLPLRPRVKRVCLRDLLILMEQEKETCRSRLLYKSYFK